jgi:hypothetical protein
MDYMVVADVTPTQSGSLIGVFPREDRASLRYTEKAMLVVIGLAVLLSTLAGCTAKLVNCAAFDVKHDSVPSHLPTSFNRDLATAKFSSCSDGRTYTVQCRHGSVHTSCECAINGVVMVKTKGEERLPDDRAAALAFANTNCEWTLR